MPTYSLFNSKTKQRYESEMKISEFESMLIKEPWISVDWENATPPQIGDPVKLGITKPPSDFQKHIIGRMKETIPGNNLGSSKFSIPKEV